MEKRNKSNQKQYTEMKRKKGFRTVALDSTGIFQNMATEDESLLLGGHVGLLVEELLEFLDRGGGIHFHDELFPQGALYVHLDLTASLAHV